MKKIQQKTTVPSAGVPVSVQNTVLPAPNSSLKDIIYTLLH